MTQLRLEGPDVLKFAELLEDAFQPDRFDVFLRKRLNKRVTSFQAPNATFPTTLYRVVDEANASLWWRYLLREARNALPTDPGFIEFAERFGQTPQIVAFENGVRTVLDRTS